MNSESRHRAALILNVILAVAAVTLVLPRSGPAPVPPPEPANPAPAVTSPPEPPRYPGAAPAAGQRRWLIDQMRALGVPNDVLARVVMAQLDKAWNQQGAELALKFHGDADKMAALQLQVDLSKDAEMRSALGEAGFRQWDQQNMLRAVNPGNLPLTAAETDQAYDFWKKLQQRQLDAEVGQAAGTMDPADINDTNELASSEFSQQMKTLLGDDRFAKSQQPDDGSNALQQDLAQANPSDSQFQALLKAQQQWNDQRTALDQQFQNDPTSSDYADELAALDSARAQEYQRVLGTNVFEAYQKSQDPGYAQMKQYETLWGLNDNQVNSTYAAIQYFQKSVQDYQSQIQALQAQGQPVDSDAVNKSLVQFADQTQQALQNYVGLDTYNKMQRNGVFQLIPTELTAHSTPAQ